MTPFAELAVTTNFSFLRGGSHPEELVARAAELGLAGIAVADRNTVAGVVRGHVMAKEKGYRYAVGARLVFRDGAPDVIAWPTDRAAWGRLCRLLTLGNRRAEKGDCHLELHDLLEWGQGMMLGVMPGSRIQSGDGRAPSSARLARDLSPPGRGGPASRSILNRHRKSGSAAQATSPLPGGERDRVRGDPLAEVGPVARLTIIEAKPGDPLPATLAALHDAFPDNVRLMANRLYGPGDRRRLVLLDRIARHYGVPLLATNDVLYHAPERRPLQDVVTCIREHRTILNAGRRLEANAERHLKDAAEMARLFRDYPEAVAESFAVLERLEFSLDQLRYNYPDEPTGDAASPQEALIRFTEEGARFRYPDGVPEKVRATIAHELTLIESRDYAPYFLTVHDIVRFARGRGILCQGRGSAANSAVCYCLGITEVNPGTTDLLFERFISPERNEPPDIDVDFEHERREEVMQYIYGKYGRERTGIAATVISYRARSAVREVGKVFGLSDDTIGALSGTIWGWSSEGVRNADIARVGLDPAEKTMRQVALLSQELIGFPRHLSQHVGGFVMTRDRLDEMVPIMNAAMEDRTNIEWDKDDLDAVGMLKVDVLALGMLSCIRRAFEFMKKHYGWAPTLATIQNEDPAVYDMLCRADSLGVFQVESRAQMTMLPRLKPREFYDLVIEVAIVRPGPIQGDMVHPYLRRRQGLEKVRYPAPSPEHGPADELEKVLGRTLGVPLFQEQAMKIAMVAAKFSGGEADKLRRAMATFRRTGTIHTFRDKMVEGMVARGYERAFAERCFQQIEGFGEYGFPESHAASFALLVYASSWIKCHYPDVFCAALLNAQPMGFYAPAQIVRDATRHGIAVRPVDVNFSQFDATLEPGPPLPLWERALPLGEAKLSLEAKGEGTTPSTSAHARARGHPAFTRPTPELKELDPRLRGDEQMRGGSPNIVADDPDTTLMPGHPPLPSWERALPLGEPKASLEAKGEGDPPLEKGSAPSPAFSRLAFGSPRESALSHEGRGEARLHPANAEMEHEIRSTHVVRLGFRQIKGFREEDATALTEARGKGYDSVRDLWLRSGLTRAAIERLADADAFRSLGLDRRDALWAARELGGGKADDRLPLFDVAELADIRSEPDFALPPMPVGEHVVNDYRYLSLSLKAHPVSFIRQRLFGRGIVASETLRDTRNGKRVTVSGLAIVRQRPGTASGVIFMTIEDETDIANIVVWPKVFEKFRPVVLGARFVAVTGKVQSESGVIHVIADRIEDLTPMLGILSAESEQKPAPGEAIDPRARADEVRRPGQDHRERAERRAGMRHPRTVRFFEGGPATPDAARTIGTVMPKGRNFH